MKKCLILGTVLSLLCSVSSYGAIWYVDKDQTAKAEDGTSWDTPRRSGTTRGMIAVWRFECA